jgi:hypothetical protein
MTQLIFITFFELLTVTIHSMLGGEDHEKVWVCLLFTGVMALMFSASSALAGKWAVVLVDIQGDFTLWKNGSLAVAGSDKTYVQKAEAALRELKKKRN